MRPRESKNRDMGGHDGHGAFPEAGEDSHVLRVLVRFAFLFLFCFSFEMNLFCLKKRHRKVSLMFSGFTA